MNTPILLIVFNRPDTVKHVFEVIRKFKPKKLYISSDGPRAGNESDVEKNNKVKEIVQDVDWDCDVEYRFLEENVGCGLGPSSAISWAFEKEDRLIILEDDCVPAQPFFPYCDSLLEKYNDDERIWLISGRAHHPEYHLFHKYDYLFTYFGHTWGWATWKRCWNNFDIDMKDFPLFMEEGGFYNVFYNPKIGKYYNKKFLEMSHDQALKTHAWDYQWVYTRLKNKGLSIVPSKNMIHNIGAIGTHSSSTTVAHKLVKHEDYELKTEPHFILPVRDYEDMHFKKHINVNKQLVKKVLRKALSILKLK